MLRHLLAVGLGMRLSYVSCCFSLSNVNDAQSALAHHDMISKLFLAMRVKLSVCSWLLQKCQEQDLNSRAAGRYRSSL